MYTILEYIKLYISLCITKNNVNSYFMIWLIILMTSRPARNQRSKGEPQGTTSFSPKIVEKLYFLIFLELFHIKMHGKSKLKNCEN